MMLNKTKIKTGELNFHNHLQMQWVWETFAPIQRMTSISEQKNWTEMMMQPRAYAY